MPGYTYTILTGTKATEGSIRYWCNHSLIPADQALVEAEAMIYEGLRAREMIVSAEISVAASASTFTLPSDFIEPIKLMPDGWGDPMPFMHENLHQRIRNSDGTLESGEPSQWTIANEVGEFDSQLSDAMEMTLWYYKTPAALSAQNETNFLTARYPRLLRYACMAVGYDMRKRRADALEMKALTQAAIDSANVEADRGRRGQIRMR